MKVGTANEATRISWIKGVLSRIPAGSRILDAGAGERRFRSFCSHLNYVSQDFARYDGKGDGRGLQTGSWNQDGLDIICDISLIPESDSSFDSIMCIEVFEHLPNPHLALKEFSRLLRPGGWLILTAPFCSLTHFAPYHFYSGFNRYFYENQLQEYRLDILELESNGNFFEYLAQEVRRIPSIMEQYAGSRPKLADRVAMSLLLKLLGRCSRNDHGSDAMLCFGYHVLARKR